MKEYDELTPQQQKAVRALVARVYLALGVAVGGLIGTPKSWWLCGAALLYAFIGLIRAAFRDEVYDDQTTDR